MRSNARSVATLAIGVSLFGVTSYLLYLLLKKETDDDYSETIPLNSIQSRLEVKIPKEFVRNVIGRNGAHIKEIEKKSHTKINFKDQQKNEEFRICIVRGTNNNCLFAESLIHEFIANQPIIETSDIYVPRVATGRIIGKSGERVHYITQLSGSKIHVSPESENSDSAERRIVIKGTREQIETATSYIVDIVREDTDARRKLEAKLAKREPRGKPRNSASVKNNVRSKQSWETLSSTSTGHESQMEVYVSAVVDPSQFWLQIVGPKANELDQLVEEMTDYYTKQENLEVHIISDPTVGEIVASVFMYDGKWYRAEIIELRTNEKNIAVAQLYFVDYGDTDVVPVAEIYELRTDFLRIRCQAIECYLARIKPIGDNWTDEAIDRFEEWTQVAQWKKLRARVNGYKDRNKSKANGRGKREGSPIPGVDLYDVNNQDDLDIGMELVKQGYAALVETVNGAKNNEEGVVRTNISNSQSCDFVVSNGNGSLDSLPELNISNDLHKAINDNFQ